MEDSRSCKLCVYVSPGSKVNKIIGISFDGMVSIKIAAPAVEGKANLGMVKYLAELLDVSKSKICLLRGEKSRKKVLQIQTMSHDEVMDILKQKIE